jgi:hypothetical protein
MSLNYDEAIAELRQEEKRLLTELEQVRAAIPGLIILRNRNQGGMAASPDAAVAKPTLPGIGRFAGVGATQAIPELLKGASVAMTNREICDALQADGWTTEARRPVATIGATMAQLAEKHIVEKVGEGWRLKINRQRLILNPEVFSSIAHQQPS